MLCLAHVYRACSDDQAVPTEQLTHDLGLYDGLEVEIDRWPWAPSSAIGNSLRSEVDSECPDWVVLDTGSGEDADELLATWLKRLTEVRFAGQVIVLAPDGTVSLDDGPFEVAIFNNEIPDLCCQVARIIAQKVKGQPLPTPREAMKATEMVRGWAAKYPDAMVKDLNLKRSVVEGWGKGKFE